MRKRPLHIVTMRVSHTPDTELMPAICTTQVFKSRAQTENKARVNALKKITRGAKWHGLGAEIVSVWSRPR